MNRQTNHPESSSFILIAVPNSIFFIRIVILAIYAKNGDEVRLAHQYECPPW